MGNDVYIAGIGMTRFTTHLDKTHHELCALALDDLFKDAGLDKESIECVFFSNSAWGHFEKQHGLPASEKTAMWY